MTKWNEEALQKRLEELKSKDSGKLDRYIWTPKPGKYIVRCLPYPHEKLDMWPIRYFHNNVGGKYSILCPQTNKGDYCPICEWVEKMLEDRLDKEIFTIVKKAGASAHGFMPILIRKEKDGDNPMVRLWRLNSDNEEHLIAAAMDDEYSHFIDVKKGIDMIVEKEDKDKVEYPKIKFINWQRSDSSVADTNDEIKEILKIIPNIDEVFTYEETDSLKKILSDHMKKALGIGVEGEDLQDDRIDEALNQDDKVFSEEKDDLDSKLDEVIG